MEGVSEGPSDPIPFLAAHTNAIHARDTYDGTRAADDQLIEALLALEQYINLSLEEFRRTISCCLSQCDGDRLAGISDGPRVPSIAERYLDQALAAYEELLRSANTVEELARTHNIPFQPLHFTLVETKDQEGPETGSGEGMEFRFVQRLQTLILALRDIRIFKDDISLHEEELRPEMMRRAPYVLMRIPKLDKGVLLSSQVGEATFVVSGAYTPGTKKEQIVERGGRLVVHRTDEQWTGEILEELQQDPRPPLTPERDMRNPAYYTQQNVLLDLSQVVAEVGVNIHELNVGPRCVKAFLVCSNGRRMTFRTYLQYASVALGFSKNTSEIKSQLAILALLKKIAGYEAPEPPPPIDAKYFSNPTWVREDLISVALAADLNSFTEVTTSPKCTGKTIKFCNGESMTFMAYLSRAGVSLDMCKTRSEGSLIPAAILARLKEIAGYEAPEPPPPLDAKYFSNPTWVREDLITASLDAGLDSFTKLSTKVRNPIRLCNGQSMTFQTYLSIAGVAFGLFKTTREASCETATILARLKQIAGYETPEPPSPLDAKYFSNPTWVREDLISVSLESGLKSFTEVSTAWTNGAVRIRCCNGQYVQFQTYLSHAGVALGMCNTKRGASSKPAAILARLKEIAGYQAPEPFAPLDARYFSNPTWVREDLVSASLEAGLESLVELTTATSQNIICCNGQSMTFQTYLRQAGIALGMCSNTTEAASQMAAILARLKEIAGYEASDPFPPLDAKYFSNPTWVREDLISFSLVIKLKSFIELTTGQREIPISCCNGESLVLRVYIARAGIGLGICTTVKEALAQSSAVLARLKKIAGYEAPEPPPPLDARYFSNPTWVREDLISVSLERGLKSFIELSTSPKCVNTKIVACNGQNLQFQTYLTYAGVALGMCNTKRGATHKPAAILARLKEIAGYEAPEPFPPLDARYFSNPTWVREDLISVALAAGLESFMSVTTTHINKRITCCNGQSINFLTYLRQAGIAFGIFRRVVDASSHVSEVLAHLKEIAGVPSSAMPTPPPSLSSDSSEEQTPGESSTNQIPKSPDSTDIGPPEPTPDESPTSQDPEQPIS